MLGDISPQTVRIAENAVVYPGRNHVTTLTIKRYNGRNYKPVDLDNLTRVVLVFPDTTPTIAFDSLTDNVFDWGGNVLTIDLSDYAMPNAVHPSHLIVFDAEHPQGQVLVDDLDSRIQFDFRLISTTGALPPPTVEFITDAPQDGDTYGRKDGAWVSLQAVVSGVASVNGQAGIVVLDAADVGAATTAQGALADSAVQPGDLAAVATSGAYADLSGTPTLGTAASANTGDFDPAGAAAGAVAAHVGEGDPHPQYQTQAEGDARYERGLVAGTNITIDRTNPAAPVINAAGGGGGGAVDSVNGQTGVVVLDAADVGADATGTAATAVAAHVAAADPHTQYLTGTEADAAYAPLSHVGDSGAAHANAVASGAAGFMTGADKEKLDGVAAGATANPDTDSLTEGATNKWFTVARVLAAALTGLSVATGGAVVDTDTVLQAIGKLQKQITDLATAVAAKMSNPMTTAGDIIVGEVAGAPGRVAKGTDGQVFKMVAGSPAWAPVVSFSASKVSGGDQNIAANAATKITFETEDFDTGSGYNPATSRYTIPSGAGGKWFFGAAIIFTASNSDDAMSIRIYKNGAQVANIGYAFAGKVVLPTISGSTMFEVADGDYLEIYVYSAVSTGTRPILALSGTTRFYGFKAD